MRTSPIGLALTLIPLTLACAGPGAPAEGAAGASEPALRCVYEAPTGSHLPAWICDGDGAAERRRVARELLGRPAGGGQPALAE